MTMSIVEIKKVDKPAGRYLYDKYRKRGYYEKDERQIKTRLYIFPDNESVAENLIVGRWTRPYKQWRVELLPAILEHFGLDPAIKAKWNQHAGCSCNCSPGFVLDKALGYDIYVTASYDRPTLTPEQEAVAVGRYEQVLADPTLAGPLGLTQ